MKIFVITKRTDQQQWMYAKSLKPYRNDCLVFFKSNKFSHGINMSSHNTEIELLSAIVVMYLGDYPSASVQLSCMEELLHFHMYLLCWPR